jgi:hypothetical protein
MHTMRMAHRQPQCITATGLPAVSGTADMMLTVVARQIMLHKFSITNQVVKTLA